MRIVAPQAVLDESEFPTTIHEAAQIILSADDRPLDEDEIYLDVPPGTKEIVVGITESCTQLASFPATMEGYANAVYLIDHLENHEDGIYYLDVPENIKGVLA